MIKPNRSHPIAKLAGLSLVSSIVLLWTSAALAQRRPIADETLGDERTIVTPVTNIRGRPGDRIEGGARRGNNLFHSFRDFQVDTGRGVYFTDPGVDNILGRVTGGIPTEVLGTLGVLGGDANLFLINPSGIIFGENARLDVGGSFAATTANAIGFGNQGWFAVADPNAPLLTVQPSAFLFNQINPGAIENQSTISLGDDGLGNEVLGLEVPSGQNLVFLGGTVVNRGNLNAFGGRIELGSVAGLGTVGLDTNGSLSFPSEIARADVRITDGSQIDVASDSGGDIVINARNIDISDRSALRAGIFSGLGTVDSQAGNVVLNGTGEVQIRQSGVINNIETNATGRGGNIDITADSLFVTNGAQLSTSTSGQGDAGNVSVHADDRAVFNDTDSAAFSSVNANGTGRGGNIDITADSLFVTNGAQLLAITNGRGNAGNVVIHADDQVVFDGTGATGLASAAFSSVEATGIGNGGSIDITADSLFVTNGAQLLATTNGRGNAGNVVIHADDQVVFDDGNAFSTVGTVNFDGIPLGNGGNIEIYTNSLEVRNGAQLQAATFGRGNAGSVIIHATDRVVFDGTGADGSFSAAFSNVANIGFDGMAERNGGNIEIDANSLEVRNGAGLIAINSGRGNAGNVIIHTNFFGVRNGAQLQTFTRGQGNAGSVIIHATDRAVFDNGDAFSTVEATGIGNGGNIDITTDSLFVTNGAQLLTANRGQGNGGNVEIDANSLEVFNRAQLVAATFGRGNAGSVIIHATDRVVFDNGDAFSTVGDFNFDRVAVGNGGNVEIDTTFLEVRNGAQLQAATFGQGRAGNIRITADMVSLEGVGNNGSSSALFTGTSRRATGQGGDIRIHANSLHVANGAVINASTETAFRGGDVIINANTFYAIGGGQIVTSTADSGRAGNITLRVSDRTMLSGFDSNYNGRDSNQGAASGLFANTRGNSSGSGGTIRIATGQLEVSERARVVVNSQGIGVAGDIEVTAPLIELDRGRLTAETSQGNGGNITLRDLNLLRLQNGSLISTTAGTDRAGGNGGNIAIDSNFIVASPTENSDITANAFTGSGGNVAITTQGLFGIQPQASPTDRSDITASSELGLQGTLDINTPDVDPSRGLTELPAAPVDASNQIAQTCPTNGNIAEALGEFVITGRGGLPANPTEILSGNAVLPRLSGLPNARTEARVRSGTNPELNQLDTVNPSPPAIVEAQEWQINTEGNVILIAAAPARSSAFAEAQCHRSD